MSINQSCGLCRSSNKYSHSRAVNVPKVNEMKSYCLRNVSIINEKKPGTLKVHKGLQLALDFRRTYANRNRKCSDGVRREKCRKRAGHSDAANEINKGCNLGKLKIKQGGRGGRRRSREHEGNRKAGEAKVPAKSRGRGDIRRIPRRAGARLLLRTINRHL
jgi:hypothetical protein